MAKINIQPDCGNAPKKVFLENLYIAYANGDIDFFIQNIQDNISWEIIGQSQITTKEKFLVALTEHKLWKIKEITLDTIITHGPDASVSGQIQTEDNSIFHFCDIHRFKSAGGTAILSIKTFIFP